jgi:CheY-like chemotaxis protein
MQTKVSTSPHEIPFSFFAADDLMNSERYRILCIGNDLDLLSSRCAVLASDGYEAESVDPVQAESALRSVRFDLVILCTTIQVQQKQEFATKIPATTKVLALDGFIRPTELLSAVAHLLASADSARQSLGPFGLR